MPEVDVIIPAFDEEQSIGKVVRGIPKHLVRNIVVVNNNSSDNTAKVAEESGAVVLTENKQGYGWACMKGIHYIIEKHGNDDIIAFMDGDFSDYGEQLELVVRPIADEGFDMVIGSRLLGKKEKGSMTLPQVFGNRLSAFLLKTLYGKKFTDLGPMRAMKADKLMALDMREMRYGWTVEMQLKAAKRNYKIREVPVDYRKRIGHSKVSGTVKGTLLAGYRILYTIIKYLRWK